MKLVLLWVLAAQLAQGASTAYWEINSYSEFLKGKLESVSLSRFGRISLAPRTDTLFSSEHPVIWSIAQGRDSTVYIATGHRGEVHRLLANGRSELVWTAPEPEVFAIAVDAKGVLYAGTSPDGQIYRIEAGKAAPYFQPKTKYIWSLAVGGDGALYAGTGEEGKIFRITAPNQGELYYETGQSHVTALAVDGQARLIAGTEPNGILYRVTAKDKAFVLYDSNLPEIRAIVPAPDGSLYVAALGGAFGKKQAGAAGAVSSIPTTPMVTAPTTTITIEAAQTQGGIEIKPKPEQPKPQTPSTPTPAAVSSAPMMDLPGVDKAAVYRIQPDNLVETLWVSKEENIYDVVPSTGNSVLFSTDNQGRIYRLEADRKATLLLETREGEATRLLATAGGTLAATSHAAKLLRITGDLTATGTYESPVHDASGAARWGRLQFQAEIPAGAKLAIRTRSGNSARPDKTWSDWSQAIATSGATITSPNARYLQWQAELTSAAGKSPELDSLSIAYLPQNTAPVVKSIQVSSQPSPSNPIKAATAGAANSVYTVTVSDSGDSAATSTGTPTTAVSRPGNGQLVLTWQTEDTDGDKLSYSIFFRAEDEREWKLLKNNWPDLALTLDADTLADGRYLFRVVASDAPSNPAPAAREADLVSAPVWIDNTPPQLKISVPARTGSGVQFDVDAVDSASPIRRAEFSLDAGPWQPLAPLDLVADSLRENFRGTLASVPPGEHVLTVRAFDSAGNAATAKAILR